MKSFLIIISLLFCIQSYGQVHHLKETIYFQFNKTKLTSAHKRKLDSIVSLMKASADYNADIKGYADNVGSLSVNLAMSKLRALSAYNYIVDKGCNKSKLSYEGLGEKDPIGDNKTREGRGLNRRDELDILLSMSADDFNNSSENQTGGNSSNSNSNSNTTTTGPVVPPPPPPPPPVPQVTLGPNFTSGSLVVDADKTIDVGNGVIVMVNKNSLVTTSKDPIEFDFKDFTQNSEVINKSIQTKSNTCKALSYHGGFSTSFVQNYQDLSINRQDPVKVLIPGEYNPNVKLFNFPRNWTLDTINSLVYNDVKKAYEVTVNEENQTFGLLETPALDTLEFIRVKITGMNPKNIKPYIIYDDCSISNGCQYSGKNFIFPIVKNSSTYRVRALFKDYENNSNGTSSLAEDITNITNLDNFKITTESGVKTYRYKKPISFKSGALKQSDYCDQLTPGATPVTPTPDNK